MQVEMHQTPCAMSTLAPKCLLDLDLHATAGILCVHYILDYSIMTCTQMHLVLSHCCFQSNSSSMTASIFCSELLLTTQGNGETSGANGTAAEDSSSSNKHSSLRNTLLLAVPTMFDLTATVLMSIGLLFVTASVYQVCRRINIKSVGVHHTDHSHGCSSDVHAGSLKITHGACRCFVGLKCCSLLYFLWSSSSVP